MRRSKQTNSRSIPSALFAEITSRQRFAEWEEVVLCCWTYLVGAGSGGGMRGAHSVVVHHVVLELRGQTWRRAGLMLAHVHGGQRLCPRQQTIVQAAEQLSLHKQEHISTSHTNENYPVSHHSSQQKWPGMES